MHLEAAVQELGGRELKNGVQVNEACVRRRHSASRKHKLREAIH
jgi:hypothetical protein